MYRFDCIVGEAVGGGGAFQRVEALQFNVLIQGSEKIGRGG